jgi:putative ABC transport system permease protein
VCRRAELAARIEQRTGLRARATEDFKADTVRWFLINSEDVGDIAAMLILAMTMGFGVTGIMLYMFTYENQNTTPCSRRWARHRGPCSA